MSRPDSRWIGSRWFGMCIGYGTCMAFMLVFGNFILVLRELTCWFRGYSAHWFGIAMPAVIVPASVPIGHRHNRTRQKAGVRNLASLDPCIDTAVPNSREAVSLRTITAQTDGTIKAAGDEETKEHARRVKAACIRAVKKTAVEALEAEGAPGAGGRRRELAALQLPQLPRRLPPPTRPFGPARRSPLPPEPFRAGEATEVRIRGREPA